MKSQLLHAVAGVALTAALIVSGCAHDSSPTQASQPGPTTSGSGGPQMTQMLQVPPVVRPVPLAVRSVSKLITARNGGIITSGGVSVIFEPGVLYADTLITLMVPDSEDVAIDVGPAGLVLHRPAHIRIARLGRTDLLQFETLSFFRRDDLTPMPTRKSWDRIEGDADVLGGFVLGEANSDQGFQPLRYLSGPGYEMAYIRADFGGTVAFDRFKVTIPRHALEEDTYITIRYPANGYLQCELEPHGIHFAVPVTLEMDMKGLGYQPYTDWTIWWLNDQTGLWEDQGGRFDVKVETVTTELWHFSSWGGGRAGW